MRDSQEPWSRRRKLTSRAPWSGRRKLTSRAPWRGTEIFVRGEEQRGRPQTNPHRDSDWSGPV